MQAIKESFTTIQVPSHFETYRLPRIFSKVQAGSTSHEHLAAVKVWGGLTWNMMAESVIMLHQIRSPHSTPYVRSRAPRRQRYDPRRPGLLTDLGTKVVRLESNYQKTTYELVIGAVAQQMLQIPT
jgi:hypothetical protein